LAAPEFIVKAKKKRMDIDTKNYYASDGWRTGLIIVAAANFCFQIISWNLHIQ